MIEDNDMNLPADSDDLSKHAPALFALKGTETGFVVPELYFEELSELVIAKTSIPEDGGLIVPENYFEELLPIVEAKTSLPAFDSAQSDNETPEGFVVPENYFEELSSIIEAKTAIPSEDGLVVPENYFQEFSASLESHIVLDNVKQDEGLVVPEGYFENLTRKVLASSSLESGQYVHTINDDEVPKGYFDSLGDKVVARLENEGTIEKKEERGRVIVLAQWKKYVAVTAVAASVALLIAFAWTFFGNTENGDGKLMAKINDKGLVPDNFVKKTPKSTSDTSSIITVVSEGIVRELPKNPKEIKPNQDNQVIMNDAIIAQSDLMDEALVMDFMTENNIIEETDEVLDPAMMEYLMNDNTSLDVFGPTEK